MKLATWILAFLLSTTSIQPFSHPLSLDHHPSNLPPGADLPLPPRDQFPLRLEDQFPLPLGEGQGEGVRVMAVA